MSTKRGHNKLHTGTAPATLGVLIACSTFGKQSAEWLAVKEQLEYQARLTARAVARKEKDTNNESS